MHTGKLIANPFVAGKPVKPESFFGRQDAIRRTFSRIHNGESTAIVGEPHIGKSSLLKYLLDRWIQLEWLGKISEQHIFVSIDGQMFTSDSAAGDFWRQVLTPIGNAGVDGQTREQCHSLLAEKRFGSFALETLFRQLDRQEKRVVLVIDEFDYLLNHPDLEFFGTLRSLATRTDGLVVIAASRMPIAEMNRLTQQVMPHGSPFFNFMIEVRLMPFEQAEADKFLHKTLANVRDTVEFSSEDCDFLYALSGGQPFLLQLGGGALFDVRTDPKAAENPYDSASQRFNHDASAHFNDFWCHLTENERHTLLLLALVEFRGYVDGRSFDLGEIGKLEWYEPDLRRLRDMGIVQSSASNLPGSIRWSDSNWRIAVGGIVPWLMDNAVSDAREQKNFAEWLRAKEYDGLLTREEKDRLQAMISKIPKGAVGMLADFINTFLRR